MTMSVTVMQYSSEFTKLSRFVLKFVASKRMKMRSFDDDLAFYIDNQLTGQPIHTYQKLYERATEVQRVKFELRSLYPN